MKKVASELKFKLSKTDTGWPFVETSKTKKNAEIGEGARSVHPDSLDP